MGRTFVVVVEVVEPDFRIVVVADELVASLGQGRRRRPLRPPDRDQEGLLGRGDTR